MTTGHQPAGSNEAAQSTPETDAVAVLTLSAFPKQFAAMLGDAQANEVVAADFARKLERQRDALKAALTAAAHALRSYQYGNSATELAGTIADKADAAIATVEKDKP